MEGRSAGGDRAGQAAMRRGPAVAGAMPAPPPTAVGAVVPSPDPVFPPPPQAAEAASTAVAASAATTARSRPERLFERSFLIVCRLHRS
ncbi:hypothetical protein [Phaeacidiphilus oryzae]|uniref:hypothetical protein n=1 Tax=Phaeacidiphilus oryzae TaxID=348818 RepID=UPI0009FDAAB6|nr:hypothetical protein [Phaeacidiphilus oryzae]